MDRHATLTNLILRVHARNGGTLKEVDLTRRLLDPVFQIDSLDLAEIMAAIEKEFRVYPFESAVAPKTWGDIYELVASMERQAA